MPPKYLKAKNPLPEERRTVAAGQLPHAVFCFHSKSWKEASGEDDKAGWVKLIPKECLPRDFKVGGRAPKAKR